MRSGYKRIGDFIRLVDERNRHLKITTLLGLSIDKVFIPSVANTVGSNMANYKIIRKGQFACSLMQVRRDKKMPVALLSDLDEIIISQAYPVFEITDQNELLPEYLMMWMSRPEFDRHACFLAVGGVRGSLEWEDFCDMELPVPSPEKQREIVREYNFIVDRIKLNEKLNQKLEETAQAIYKHWFVDFEFPISREYAASIGKPELENQPYKSSGGEMKYCEELEQEIPRDWTEGVLGDLIDVKNGFAFKSSEFFNDGDIPIIKINNLTPPNVDIEDAQFFRGQLDKKLENYLVEPGDILISMTGSHMNQMSSAVGKVGRYNHEFSCLQNQRVGNLKPKDNLPCREYVYYLISSKNTHRELLLGATGSANQANISPDQIKAIKIATPPTELINIFDEIGSRLVNRIILNDQMDNWLHSMRKLVTANNMRVQSS